MRRMAHRSRHGLAPWSTRAGATAAVLALATAAAVVVNGLGAVPPTPSSATASPAPGAAASPASATASPAPGAAASPASATASPAPTPAPLAARPPTADGPVPADLVPSLAAAATDYPAPYLDGCHVPMDGRRPARSCVYGKTASSRVIVLFGDSHALAWFPAVRSLAWSHGWRLVSLTMSACSPADIPQWIPAQHRVSAPCADWRRWALSRIQGLRPYLTLVAGTRGFATTGPSGEVLTGDARVAAWQAGIERTLDRIAAASRRVIYLSDTPASILDPPVCLAAHRTSLLACATPIGRALSPSWFAEEEKVASAESVDFVDTTLWVCPTSPCPTTIGHYLVYRDGGHMTATFVASLASVLGAAVDADIARRQPREGTG